MPEVIKFSKGTVAEHNNFTGENGEITLICDDSPNRKVTGVIRLHDGQTVGGIPFGGSQLLNDLHDVNAANTIANQILTANANGEFYFANTVETIADGTISGDKIFGGTITTNGAVISGSSTGDLVRITQTGTGNALVVEDSTNPDSTTFVIDASGNVGIADTGTISNRLTVVSGDTNSVRIVGSGNQNLYSYSDSNGVGWATGANGSYDNLLYFHNPSDSVYFYAGPSSPTFKNNATETHIYSGWLRVGRTRYNWFAYGGNPSGRYMHIKTGLWSGQGPNNSQPTMSMFHIKGYNYSAQNFDSMIGFHNWNGLFYNLILTNNGTRAVAVNPYVSSDGYVVLVVDCGTNYPGFTIDHYQQYPYTFQNFGVTANQDSTNTTGVY